MIWKHHRGLHWSVNWRGFAVGSDSFGRICLIYRGLLLGNIDQCHDLDSVQHFFHSSTECVILQPHLWAAILRENKGTAPQYGLLLFFHLFFHFQLLLFFEWQWRSLGLSFLRALCSRPSGLCMFFWFRHNSSTLKRILWKKKFCFSLT